MKDRTLFPGLSSWAANQAALNESLRLLALAGSASNPRREVDSVRLPVAMCSAQELRTELEIRGLASFTQPGGALYSVSGALLNLLVADSGEALLARGVPAGDVSRVKQVLLTILGNCTVGTEEGSVVCSDDARR